MTCRNQLMNEGKAYPRSGCDVCGTILTKNKMCAMGITPNPPAGSNLGPQHYVSTVVPSSYAVIYSESIYHEGDERSRTHPGHGYPAWTETVQKIQTFKSEQELKDWIQQNNSRKSFKAIKYQELIVNTEVLISLS